jgi:hypothetical protein
MITWERGTLQEATNVTGPWNDVIDAFSPHVIQSTGTQQFYRTRY